MERFFAEFDAAQLRQVEFYGLDPEDAEMVDACVNRIRKQAKERKVA